MSKNYKLLRTAIVTALDASNPSPRGAVWTPAETLDIHEAEALARIGVAQETKEAVTLQTAAERRANAPAKPAPLSGIVDATRQEDATFINKNGQRVNEDGSDYDDKEAARAAFLARNADDVIADIDNVPKAALAALHDLEAKGKGRKTVLEALKNAE